MTDHSQAIKIANLMCSRLCHDLISPVGAVSSAVELLQEEIGGVDPEVLGLMSRSAQESTAKLAFFRAAFGDGGGKDAQISSDHLHTLSSGVVPAGKISLQWDADSDQNLPNHAGKLLLMFVVLAVDALPRGGAIMVKIHALEDGTGMACIAEGPGANLKEGTATALSESLDYSQLTSRDVTAHYAHLLASSANIVIETSSDEGAVMLAGLLSA